MVPEIEWPESAVSSLIDAVEFIARDSPSYAAALALQADRAAMSLQQFPNRGRRVAEFDDLQVRELFVNSYRLIYRVGREKVTVPAFVHQSRDLSNLLEEPPQ